MLAPWLDQELARGMGAPLSKAHAARARQLTSDRTRLALARALDRLVNRAQAPRPACLTPLVAPCSEQVRDAMPLILSVRSRLLSEEPLATQGIARLKTLLRDRAGAFYVASAPGALAAVLQEISALLDAERNHVHSPSLIGGSGFTRIR